MDNQLLAIDTDIERFNNHRRAWAVYGVMVERASSMEEAIIKINMADVLIVGIAADTITNYLEFLPILRLATRAPIFVMTDHKTVKEHQIALKNGADVFEEWMDNYDDHAIRGLLFLEGYSKRHDGKNQLPHIHFTRDITIFPDARKTLIHGREIELVHKEYEVLLYLMENKDRILTFEQIFDRVWGTEYGDEGHKLLWNQVGRLRKKINRLVVNHEYIQNEREIGYRLVTPPDWIIHNSLI